MTAGGRGLYLAIPTATHATTTTLYIAFSRLPTHTPTYTELEHGLCFLLVMPTCTIFFLTASCGRFLECTEVKKMFGVYTDDRATVEQIVDEMNKQNYTIALLNTYIISNKKIYLRFFGPIISIKQTNILLHYIPLITF